MDIREEFSKRFGHEPEIIVRAPGRVNLIGEHTDYNDGFVLPVAIDRYIYLAVRPAETDQVWVHSLDFEESVSFSLDDVVFDKVHPWSNYIRGVVDSLSKKGCHLSGMEALVAGNVPQGSGLSSSAALEVATAFALDKLNSLRLGPQEMALICQKAENDFVGVKCGIMDQFISCLGVKGNALFIDCRSLDFRVVPINLEDTVIVICNTNVKRGLVDSEYNRRREECQEGVDLLKNHLPEIDSLRDVSVEDFNLYHDALPKVIGRRCRHVVYENQRVRDAVDALQEGDRTRFGELLYLSHRSLKDDYQVSCRELDEMVEIASSIDGVCGGRMTGAGFGGCTLNLVEEDSLDRFVGHMKENYPRRTGIEADIYVCQVEDGVKIIKSPSISLS